MIWSPRNKRPERLRDSIKEVEVSFSDVYMCVCVCGGDMCMVCACLYSLLNCYALQVQLLTGRTVF